MKSKHVVKIELRRKPRKHIVELWADGKLRLVLQPGQRADASLDIASLSIRARDDL